MEHSLWEETGYALLHRLLFCVKIANINKHIMCFSILAAFAGLGKIAFLLGLLAPISILRCTESGISTVINLNSLHVACELRLLTSQLHHLYTCYC